MIREEIARRGTTPHRVAMEAGLPENAIRTVVAGRQPRADRLEQICRALGLEFYVGPRRPTVPQEVTQALKLERDCDVATAVDKIASLSDTMSAVQARGEALIKAHTQRGGEALGREIERFNRLHRDLEARQEGFLPVTLAAGVELVEGVAGSSVLRNEYERCLSGETDPGLVRTAEPNLHASCRRLTGTGPWRRTDGPVGSI